MSLRDAATDLLLGSACVGCHRPGRIWCRGCDTSTQPWVAERWPTPAPAGLVGPWSAAEYDGAVRELIAGHKEHRLFALCRPLSALLAATVQGCPVGEGSGVPTVLVPVPSRPSVLRTRGYDATAALVAQAAARLRARGSDVIVAPLLVSRAGVVDQAGLSATARSANLAGSMACPSAGVRRLARRRPRARLVVCDDVITSGATAAEACRALAAAGLPVEVVATIAATRRRTRG